MMTAKLFDPSRPRDDHGKWTSGGGGGGGGASTPPRPETLRSNIYGLLNQWSELASSSNVGSNLIMANNLDALAGAIVDWLGPGSFQQNSPNGSIQFFSSDRSRIIRFDLGGHGLGPHINVEPRRIHIFI